MPDQYSENQRAEIKRLKAEYKSLHEKYQTVIREDGDLAREVDILRARIAEYETDNILVSQTIKQRDEAEHQRDQELEVNEELRNELGKQTDFNEVLQGKNAGLTDTLKAAQSDRTEFEKQLNALDATIRGKVSQYENDLTAVTKKRDEAMASLSHLTATIAQQSEYIGSLENQRRILWKANTALVDRNLYERIRNTIPQGDFIPPFNPDGFSEISGDSPVMVGREFRPEVGIGVRPQIDELDKDAD